MRASPDRASPDTSARQRTASRPETPWRVVGPVDSRRRAARRVPAAPQWAMPIAGRAVTSRVLWRAWRHKVQLALREEAAFAARMPADELPHRQLDADKGRAPGEVHQVALVAAMDGRRLHCTAGAGRGRSCCRELESHRVLRKGHFDKVDCSGGWKQR
jgi:hypothetical protein